jgi:hypothetical protein
MLAPNPMVKNRLASFDRPLFGTVRSLPRFAAHLLLLFAPLLLSGCLLISGEQSAQDAQTAGGNVTTTFVSAEGSEKRFFEIGGEARFIHVIGIVSVTSGDLGIDLLDGTESVLFSINSRPGESITRSGRVEVDEQGRLNYQIRALGARDGMFQLLYQEE